VRRDLCRASQNGCDLLAGQILADGPIKIAIARAESKRGGEGWSQRTQKLEIAELNPQRASSSRDFLCRIWYLCWNLVITQLEQAAYSIDGKTALLKLRADLAVSQKDLAKVSKRIAKLRYDSD
jgi:hypothetical protein